jgi:hypothetical protein
LILWRFRVFGVSIYGETIAESCTYRVVSIVIKLDGLEEDIAIN